MSQTSNVLMNPLVAQPAAAPAKLLDAVVAQHSEQSATMQIRFERQGKTQYVNTPFPESLERLTPLQTVGILQANPLWATFSGDYLLNVVAWCRANGLDPVTGDVYPIDGKINTSDIAKIKYGRSKLDIEYLTVSDMTQQQNPRTGAKDFFVESRLKLRGESEPRTYKAWLSEWYNEKNKNWQKNPTDSLQRKCMARLFHFTAPIGSEGDEFIAAQPEAPQGAVAAAVSGQ